MFRTQMPAITVALILIFAVDAHAQIDNLTNMSSQWIRMSNRNAATDAPDIMVYNPAGLTGLAQGYHMDIANQFMVRRPEHSYVDPITGRRFTDAQDSPDLFVPNLYAAYTEGRAAVFAGIYIPGGGISVDYPDGSYTTRSLGAQLIGPEGPFYGSYTVIAGESLKADSTYLALSAGAAYRMTDVVSVAMAVRTIQADNSIDGRLTLAGGLGGAATPDAPLRIDVEETARGWGGILGIQATPLDDLVLAMRYETRVKLNFEADVNTDDIGLYADGEKNRRDFPAMLGLGVSYRFTPELRCEADFNWFFQKQADWGEDPQSGDIASDAGDVWSIGASAAYQAYPDLEVSCGFLYTRHDWGDMDDYYNASLGAFEVLYSDNVNLAAGVCHLVRPGVKINCGLSYTIWADESILTPIGTVDSSNRTVTGALGINIAFPAPRAR